MCGQHIWLGVKEVEVFNTATCEIMLLSRCIINLLSNALHKCSSPLTTWSYIIWQLSYVYQPNDCSRIVICDSEYTCLPSSFCFCCQGNNFQIMYSAWDTENKCVIMEETSFQWSIDNLQCLWKLTISPLPLSPLVLGNLWDVTDRDIDRFTKALLESWLSAGSGAPLLDHMGPSRRATHLKHLIGAAPVVYGLPIHLQ